MSVCTPKRRIGRVEELLHSFLTSENGGEWSASGLKRSNPCVRASGSHITGAWVRYRVSMCTQQDGLYLTSAVPQFGVNFLPDYGSIYATETCRS
jgi:hypothetical protein